jgi:hypothetical protein
MRRRILRARSAIPDGLQLQRVSLSSLNLP